MCVCCCLVFGAWCVLLSVCCALFIVGVRCLFDYVSIIVGCLWCVVVFCVLVRVSC